MLKVNPPAMHSILERVAAEEEEEGDGHYQEEEEGGAHSLKDVCDLRRPAPSPFSSRRVMFENEQVGLPACGPWTGALPPACSGGLKSSSPRKSNCVFCLQ